MVSARSVAWLEVQEAGRDAESFVYVADLLFGLLSSQTAFVGFFSTLAFAFLLIFA